mgnify:CR=1 FL=1
MLGALNHKCRVMVCCFQIDGTITYANEDFCAVMGLNMSSYVGSCIFDCWPVDIDLNLFEVIHQLHCDRICIERAYSFRDKEYRLLEHKWYFNAFFDKDGEITVIFAVGQESRSDAIKDTRSVRNSSLL